MADRREAVIGDDGDGHVRLDPARVGDQFAHGRIDLLQRGMRLG